MFMKLVLLHQESRISRETLGANNNSEDLKFNNRVDLTEDLHGCRTE
jgi:hypothetical protein